MIIRFVIDYILQKRFLYEKIWPILETHFEVTDDSLTHQDLKRIKDVYAYIAVLAIISPLQRLRKIPLSNRNRYVFTVAGMLSGLVDDFYDKFKLSNDRIRQLVFSDEEHQAQNKHQKLTIILSNILKAECNIDLIKIDFESVLYWQNESLNQSNVLLSPVEIENITIHKAGYSGWLYADMIEPIINHDDRNMIWHLCVMIQIANDIFDIHKDIHEGIYTAVNKMEQPKAMRIYFEKYIEVWLKSLYALNYTKADKQKFADTIFFLVIARTYVCLEQYTKLYQTHGHFEPSKYSRKQLVCDMEKWRNIFRWFWFFANRSI